MRPTRSFPRALLIAVAVVAAVGVGTAGVVLATPGSGIGTTIVSLGLFRPLHVETRVAGHQVSLETHGRSDVYVVDNVLAPGGSTGWHTHLGASLITVKSGTITAYEGDDPTCTPHVYRAGDGFVDPGGGHIHVLRNEGTVAAETIAVQFLPHGAARRTDVPDPGNCHF